VYTCGRILSPLLAVTIFLYGCDPDCTGVSCGDKYNAADALVFDGSVINSGFFASSNLSLDKAIKLEGDSSEGRNWSFLVHQQRLFIGKPEAGTVEVRQPFSTDSSSIPTIQGTASDGFGATLASWEQGLAIGAPNHAPAGSGAEAGALYLFAGLNTGWQSEIEADSGKLIVGEAGERLGARLASCGDIDGDGGDDLAIQSEWGDDGGALSGAVSLLSSSTTTFERNSLISIPSITGHGGKLGSALSCSASFGSLDTTPELLAGAPFIGYDPSDLPEDTGDYEQGKGVLLGWSGGSGLNSGPSLISFGIDRADYFGWSMATGDLDGDGKQDLVVGAPGDEEGMEGAVYIFLEEKFSGRFTIGFEPITDPIEPNMILRGDYTLENSDELREDALLARLGESVAIGDLNGDGIADLVVGAPGRRDTTGKRGLLVETGRVWVLLGPMNQWSEQLIPNPMETEEINLETAPVITITGDATYMQLGSELAVGDLNGDGLDELVLLARKKG
jgi:hypothetical protein